MKNILLLLSFTTISLLSISQPDTLDFDDPLLDSLKQNIDYLKINYPTGDEYLIKNKTISVIVSFLIHPDGNISELNIEKGFNTEIDSSALKHVGYIPDFPPVIINNRPYYIRYMVPVIFFVEKK